MTRRTLFVLGFVMLLVAALSYSVFAPPAGARSPASMKRFDAARMANLELRMWQAYYDKANVRLFTLLVMVLHEQYRYSWAVATREAFHLARAASRFGNLTSNYDVVLPDLEDGYATAKEWLHADFDPHAVAQAELAWWVARRVPGQNSPEQVGLLMAESYALLYDVPKEDVFTAALLRAQAAALRDAQAKNPDWNEIERYLQQSYADLRQALSTQTA